VGLYRAEVKPVRRTAGQTSDLGRRASDTSYALNRKLSSLARLDGRGGHPYVGVGDTWWLWSEV
jgi:hypothetical protein